MLTVHSIRCDVRGAIAAMARSGRALVRRLVLTAVAVGGAGAPAPLHAVIFYSTADTSLNTTAPSGALANSGWQWQGDWGSFSGTMIGPHHFITVGHAGGIVGQAFSFGGLSYTTTRVFDDPETDLSIWEVREAFPTSAALYRLVNENGRSFVAFGRGYTRGTEVRDPGTNTLRGWLYGGSPGTRRWGQNTVATAVNLGPGLGEMLYSTFDASGGTNECHLATYDSGGAIFIKDGSIWKLAGIAYAVSAYFSTTGTDSGFLAAVFDLRGLYYGSTGSWTYFDPNPAVNPAPIPSGFYCIRISSRTAWIDGVLATPLTAMVTLSNLEQTYDGSPRAVTVTTLPAGLAVSVTYNGSSVPPNAAGRYAVVATVTEAGYVGSASGTLNITAATSGVAVPGMNSWALFASAAGLVCAAVVALQGRRAAGAT